MERGAALLLVLRAVEGRGRVRKPPTRRRRSRPAPTRISWLGRKETRRPGDETGLSAMILGFPELVPPESFDRSSQFKQLCIRVPFLETLTLQPCDLHVPNSSFVHYLLVLIGRNDKKGESGPKLGSAGELHRRGRSNKFESTVWLTVDARRGPQRRHVTKDRSSFKRSHKSACLAGASPSNPSPIWEFVQWAAITVICKESILCCSQILK